MKQAVLLSLPEVNALKRGRMLEIAVGGETILIGCDKDPKDVQREQALRKARAVYRGGNGRRKK